MTVLTRRDLLRGLAATALAASGNPAAAGRSRMAQIIAEAQTYAEMPARLGFVSHALLGTRYRAFTLIGGPKRPEVMVTRDDAFDCVTYCETVLAAALARTPDDFIPVLRRIRYRSGIVNWFERNHYYYEWSERNVANHLCRALDLPDETTIEKTVSWHRALGRRHFTMKVIPRASLLANTAMLATGDLIGFVTRRPNLDYFHTGFVVFDGNGRFLLRHAAQSRGRVLDEPMENFLAANRVRYVTLLRPQPAADAPELSSAQKG